MADALILAFETADGCGGVALTRGDLINGKILAEYSLQPEKTHSRRLLGLVENMLAAAETGWRDLGAIAVSQGPGSFTGLRIGMAAAKGLATALDLPLIGVPTLDALAEQMPVPGFRLCPVLDARKHQVYAACYLCSSDGMLQPESDYMVLEPERLIVYLQEKDQPTLLFGPGASLCRSFAGEKLTLLEQRSLHPRAALVGLCAARKLAAYNDKTTRPLAPLYVRASEAELNLRREK